MTYKRSGRIPTVLEQFLQKKHKPCERGNENPDSSDINKNDKTGNKDLQEIKAKPIMYLNYRSHAKRVADRIIVNDLMKKKEK